MGRSGGRSGGGRSGGGRSSSGSRRSSSFGTSRVSGTRSVSSRSSSSGSVRRNPFYFGPRRRTTIIVGGNTNVSGGAEQQNTPPPKPEYIVCKYCGAKRKYGADDTRCPSCGSSEMGEIIYDNGSTNPNNNTAAISKHHNSFNKGKIILISVAVLLVLATVLWQIFSSYKVYNKDICDTHNTKWFNFTVNSADNYFGDDYEGGIISYPGKSGYMAVVIEMTIKNTGHETLPIYDDDFVLIGSNLTIEETYYIVFHNDYISSSNTTPYYQYFNTSSVSMFEFTIPAYGKQSFEIPANETVTKLLVYIIPDDIVKATLNYDEYDGNKKIAEYNVKIFT